MTREKMTYSYSAVADCMEAIKNAAWTVDKKAEHFAKWMEVKRLFDICYEKTGCVLFEEGWCSYLEDYTKMQNEPKFYTKKEMDKILRRCIEYLWRELILIKEAMEAGDVNAEL